MEIWEKQENETMKQFYWFQKYRDLGVYRTFKKVLELEGKSGKQGLKRRIEQLSVDNNWVKRCEAYDEHIAKETSKKVEQDIIDMNKRHIQQALLMQKNVIQKLQETNASDLSIMDCTRMYDIAVKVERLARGLKIGETSVEIKNSVDLKESNILPIDRMSSEDRKLYLEMLMKYKTENESI